MTSEMLTVGSHKNTKGIFTFKPRLSNITFVISTTAGVIAAQKQNFTFIM